MVIPDRIPSRRPRCRESARGGSSRRSNDLVPPLQAPSGRTVATPITETGELDLRGSTGLGSLMAIGATIHIASREQTGRVIQTDAKGLDSSIAIPTRP